MQEDEGGRGLTRAARAAKVAASMDVRPVRRFQLGCAHEAKREGDATNISGHSHGGEGAAGGADGASTTAAKRVRGGAPEQEQHNLMSNKFGYWLIYFTLLALSPCKAQVGS